MNPVLYTQLTNPVTGNLLCLRIKRLAEFSITGSCWEENNAQRPKLTALTGCVSSLINMGNKLGQFPYVFSLTRKHNRIFKYY